MTGLEPCVQLYRKKEERGCVGHCSPQRKPQTNQKTQKTQPQNKPQTHVKPQGWGGEVAESQPGQHRLVRTGPHLQGK